MTAKDFIAAVRDEVDSFRIEYAPPEHYIDDISNNRKSVTINYLSSVHAAIGRSGLRLDDAQRHLFFTRIFGRKITSAYQLTNVEVVALSKICRSMHRDQLADYVKEVIS